jgi:hypothetical protein
MIRLACRKSDSARLLQLKPSVSRERGSTEFRLDSSPITSLLYACSEQVYD